MSDVSRLNIGGTDYDIKDSTARGSLRHVILNGSGNAMPSRSKLQFNNATIVDDASNDITKITTSGGGGAGSGSNIYISTSESSLFGQNVTVSDGTNTVDATIDSSGNAVVEGYEHTGWITISASDGTDTAVVYLNLMYFGNYDVELSFWSAKVNISTTSEEFYGKTIYVASDVAPPTTLTFDNSGRAIYYAYEPGEYIFHGI